MINNKLYDITGLSSKLVRDLFFTLYWSHNPQRKPTYADCNFYAQEWRRIAAESAYTRWGKMAQAFAQWHLSIIHGNDYQHLPSVDHLNAALANTSFMSGSQQAETIDASVTLLKYLMKIDTAYFQLASSNINSKSDTNQTFNTIDLINTVRFYYVLMCNTDLTNNKPTIHVPEQGFLHSLSSLPFTLFEPTLGEKISQLIISFNKAADIDISYSQLTTTTNALNLSLPADERLPTVFQLDKHLRVFGIGKATCSPFILNFSCSLYKSVIFCTQNKPAILPQGPDGIEQHVSVYDHVVYYINPMTNRLVDADWNNGMIFQTLPEFVKTAVKNYRTTMTSEDTCKTRTSTASSLSDNGYDTQSTASLLAPESPEYTATHTLERYRTTTNDSGISVSPPATPDEFNEQETIKLFCLSTLNTIIERVAAKQPLDPKLTILHNCRGMIGKLVNPRINQITSIISGFLPPLATMHTNFISSIRGKNTSTYDQLSALNQKLLRLEAR